VLQDIRKASQRDGDEPPMSGTVKENDTHMDGKRKSKSNARQKRLT